MSSGALPTPEDGYYQQLVPVTKGVWALVQTGFHLQPIGNVTIIEQADGLVLVDAGGSPGNGRRIVDQVKALSPKPVKAVIITHWHGDHPLGLSEIVKAWPNARTIATTMTRAHLRNPATMNTSATPDAKANGDYLARIEGFRGYTAKKLKSAGDDATRSSWARTQRMLNQYIRDSDGAVTLSVAEGFDERLVLADRETPVEALFPGRANTDGDAVIWLPRQRVLITGDLVVAPIPFGFGGYPKEWVAALERLDRYRFVTLVPGHGAVQHDHSYLRQLIQMLKQVRTRVAAVASRGGTPEQATDAVVQGIDPTPFAGADPWLLAWFRSYWIEPIAKSAWREARGEPIVQSLRE
ncbi:MBL fold metallo-hydrolase [Sphingomonas cavernae]|uniref:MBL fold metallo-hydrolase n=1 Tax=Sphingomonas cavernae TaxID=2320861 RepID=A0A418W7A2_9SPHN|nr:MBL fold metallo-hydrolase [Sphingomonas cavernae]RJF85889.1 MBL fold metallo-hydrolase [Sphingomonas cavernae]